jgi:hypothetical protein
VEIKTHPTHARNTKNIMVGLGVVAFCGWATAMVIGQRGQNPEIVNIIVFICITSGFGIFIV